MSEKACVVFVADMKAQADELAMQLQAVGYIVCMTEAALKDVVAAQDGVGAPNPDIEACLIGAALKIFLIPATNVPPELIIAAGQAVKMPGKLVAVCAVGANLPGIFGEIATSVVRIDNPDLLKAVTVGGFHENPDGTKNPSRNPVRIKCQ